VVSTAASQLQGPGFGSRLGSLSVWSLHVLPSVSVREFPPGAPVSSHSPKYVRVRVDWPWLNCPSVSRGGGMCRLEGLAGVNEWGYGDRA